MNHPVHPSPDLQGAPRIPPPPAGGGRRRGTDPRVYGWAGAFVLGLVFGFVAYRFIQGVDWIFDYWLALIL